MKTFKFVALFALVNAAWAATNEKDELRRTHEEMSEMTQHVARHLREGPGGHALKEGAKNIRRVNEDKLRLDKKRAEQRAAHADHVAHAEKLRKVAEGVKQQQHREHVAPGMKHKIDAAKLGHSSKAAADGDATAKREKASVNAESMKKLAKQIPSQKLNQPSAQGAEKFKKVLPDAKKVANGVKEPAARAKKVNPESMKSAKEKMYKMSKNMKSGEEDGEH